MPPSRVCLFLLAVAAITPRSASAQLPGLTQARAALDSAARAAAMAARPTAAATASTDSAAQAATIEPIEIPLRAASAMVRIGEMNATMRLRGPVLEAKQAAAVLADSLAILTKRQAAVHPAQMTRRAISSLAADWNRWDIRVKEWAQIIRRRVVQIDSLRVELDQSRDLWQRTIARWRFDAPPQVIEESESVVRRLSDLSAAVKTRQQELLASEVELTRADETIDAGLARVDAAYSNMRQQLFRIQSPSLWSAIGIGGWPSLTETITARAQETGSSFAHFVEVNRGRILLHLAVTLVLFLTILHLRREVARLAAARRAPDDAPTDESKRDHDWVLAHPHGSTILVATLLTALLYPAAPMIVYDFALMLSALSVWTLLPSLLPSRVVRPARWGFGLMAFDRLAVILLFGTPWHRLTILMVAIAGLALTVRTRRQVRALDEAARRRPSTRWAERGLSLAVLLTAASIPANLLGNVTLALVFASAVAVLACLAVVAVAGATVMNGLFALTVDALSDDLRFLERSGPKLVVTVSRLVRAVAFAGWVAIALAALLLWDPVGRFVSGLLAFSLSVGKTDFTVASVLLFFGVIWFGAVLGRWVAVVLESDVLSRLNLPHGMAVTIATIVQYVLTAIAFFLALAASGVAVGQLTIIGGALSVGIGFGLQTIVNNFISGLILAFERPVSIGDTVQLGDLEGVVTKIGIRASVIRAATGAEVIVANGRLLDRDLINWTRTDRSRRLEVSVCVEYGCDPNAVTTLLAEVAARHRDVKHAPAPTCLFLGHGNSGSDFLVRIWTDSFDYRAVASDVRLAMDEALTGAGYSSPFPQYDLHLRSISKEAATALGREAGAALAAPESEPSTAPA